MGCYFSTGSFLSCNLTDIISVGVEHGIDVELSSAVGYSPDILATLRSVKGQTHFLVHNYFPPPVEPFVLNLAASDSEIHQKSVKLCREAINLCEKLEVPFYSVHAGFAFNLTPDDLGNPKAQRRLRKELYISREDASRQFLKTIGELAGYAKSKNVGLLVENNVSASENLDDNGESPLLLSRVDEICWFFNELNDPWVRLLLDVGHAKVSARTFGEAPETFLGRLSSHIEALHLSDNDGLRDTNRPFDETAWFVPFLPEFKSKTWIVEVSRLSLEEMVAQRLVLEKISS